MNSSVKKNVDFVRIKIIKTCLDQGERKSFSVNDEIRINNFIRQWNTVTTEIICTIACLKD